MQVDEVGAEVISVLDSPMQKRWQATCVTSTGWSSCSSCSVASVVDFSRNVSPEVFYYRSLNLVLLKDWKNAIESFDTLLEKYPNNPEISNFVGYTLVDRNIRLDEGIDLIQFAVSKEHQSGCFG